MRKIAIALCALALYMMTACGCNIDQLNSNATYTWTYSNPDGTTLTGEFNTNDAGNASFEVPSEVDCGRVTIQEKRTPQIAPVESAV